MSIGCRARSGGRTARTFPDPAIQWHDWRMRERVYRGHSMPSPKIAHDLRLARGGGRRENGRSAAAAGFDFRNIAVRTPGDPAEREASQAAVLPRVMPGGAMDGEARARTDGLAASLAPGSAGRPLPAEIRERFERRQGHPFGHVRIHTDVTSESSARRFDADAYSIGRHVMFGSGRYVPQTPAGQALLAHELTHVAQADATGSAVVSRQPAGGTTAPADPRRIVAGRSTAQRESDPDDLGTVLDALIAASRVLAPYIDPSKVRVIKGSISILSSSQFSSKFHHERGDVTPMTGDEKDPDIQDVSGLTEKTSRKILLREQRSNFGDALHEAIHRISLPAFTSVAGPANEGATEYFTRKVLAEAGLSAPTNGYDRQVQSIERLVAAVGEPVVGAAFFNFNASRIRGLATAIGMGRWVPWMRAMAQEKFDDADALIAQIAAGTARPAATPPRPSPTPTAH
jgi:hypothetical protein